MPGNPYQAPAATQAAAPEPRPVVADDAKSLSGDLLFRCLFQLLLVLFATRVVIGLVGAVISLAATGGFRRDVLIPLAAMGGFALLAAFMYWMVRSMRFSSRDVRLVGLSLEQLVAVLGLFFAVDSGSQLLNPLLGLIRQAQVDNQLHALDAIAAAATPAVTTVAGLLLMRHCGWICSRIRRWSAPATSAGTPPGTAPAP